ncbi:POC1 centriolar protein homolog [Gryllus bimaculatus]|nr:POC1 centriolar protein homolog [Gryllus bimaculatus]
MTQEREKCIFCRIYDGKEPTNSLYQDDLYMVFPDIKPAAEHHYLVITKQHIPNAKHLKSAEDQVIVSDLVRIGKQVLQERGGNLSDAIFGFHWPPFNSISHLHLHVISPANRLSFISRAIFRPDSWWFVTVIMLFVCDRFRRNSATMFLDNLEIIVGTYEEFLLGYRPKHVDQKYSLTQTFASHGHKASIRCVTSHGKMVASGGADDSIHFYDMLYRRDIGVLMHHNGTVNCVEFTPNGSHLLTGGDDGKIAILRASDFEMEKFWGSAHKGSAVIGISVHPTGKLALSVGADATLRTWNLVKGRPAYATRLGSSKCGAGWQINGVCWSPTGSFYVLGIGTKVDVYSVETAAIIYSVTTEMKVSSFCFLNDNELCVGCESGKIYLHDIIKKSSLFERKIHDQRIKSIKSVVSDNHVCVVTASSNGQIILWEYKGKVLQELGHVKTGCRITCLTIATFGYPNIKKEEESEVEEENEVDYSPEEKCSRPALPVKRGFVIVEEEIEGEHQKKQKKKKKSKRTSAASGFSVSESNTPMKKQKTESGAIISPKPSKNKDKKRKSLLADSWTISEAAR